MAFQSIISQEFINTITFNDDDIYYLMKKKINILKECTDITQDTIQSILSFFKIVSSDMYRIIDTSHEKIIEGFFKNVNCEISEIEKIQLELLQNEIIQYSKELIKLHVWSDYIQVAKEQHNDFSYLAYDIAYNSTQLKTRKISSIINLAFFSLSSFLDNYKLNNKIFDIQSFIKSYIKNYNTLVKNRRMEFLYPKVCETYQFWYK